MTDRHPDPGAGGRPSGGFGTVNGHLAYAVGDIHGRYDLLCALLEKISLDATVRAHGRTAVLIFCGDYVDRGPDTARVLDALCWLKRHAPYEVHCLRGNHDQVMMSFIRDPAIARDWMLFGGAETFVSYGLEPPLPDSGDAALCEARDDLLERLPVAHLRFLEDLELMVTLGDYVFVHAGIRPGKSLADQTEADMLWIRDDFLKAQGKHEKIVVHGHTWSSSEPELLANRIGIDTGAYETGVLSAVVLEDDTVIVLSAGLDSPSSL